MFRPWPARLWDPGALVAGAPWPVGSAAQFCEALGESGSVALVGNGPLTPAQRAQIASAGRVVRFNAVNNWCGIGLLYKWGLWGVRDWSLCLCQHMSRLWGWPSVCVCCVGSQKQCVVGAVLAGMSARVVCKARLTGTSDLTTGAICGLQSTSCVGRLQCRSGAWSSVQSTTHVMRTSHVTRWAAVVRTGTECMSADMVDSAKGQEFQVGVGRLPPLSHGQGA